jgi:hypothetical protein
MLRLLVPLLVGLLPATATGWKLRTSDKGTVLVWSPTSVALEVSTAGVDAPEAAYQAVQAAFLTWTGAGAPLSVELRQSGSTSASRDGRSTVSWVSKGWKYGDDVVGMTIAWYHPSTALVDETDIVLNLRDHSWGTGAPNPTRFDVQNVVTHEAGHFFGLAHEPSQPADVMYPSTPPGETQKRVLKADDRAGLAALVLETNSRVGARPQTTTTTSVSEIVPDGGAADQPGCSVGGGSPRGLFWTLVILAGLRLGGRCRRRAGAQPFLVTLLVLALAPAVSRGSAVLALSVEDLAARADLVASGVVLRRTAALEADGLIYTRVELRPERCYLGACRGGTVAVQIPGGEVGELGMHVEGAPQVRPGERVLLFAARRDGRLTLVGLGLGLFRLQGRLARRDLGGLALVDGGHGQPPAQLGLTELEAAIGRGLCRSASPGRRARPLSLPGPAAR